VHWTSFDHPGMRAVLSRRRGLYKGTYHGSTGTHCGNSLATSNVAIRMRVAKADIVDEEWRATDLRGTYVEESPDQLGCVGSRVSYAISASLLPPSAASVLLVQNDHCQAEGTGFIADRGYVVTNAHVVAGDNAPLVFDGSRALPARVIAFESGPDLAVLRVSGLAHPALSLTTSFIPHGEPAVMMGFPETYLTLTRAFIQHALRVGLDIHNRPVYVQGLALRARVRHGNSGGPLVTPDRDVVGVVSRGNGRNTGYAVAASEVVRIMRRAQGSSKAVGTGSCLPPD
jgi:S1-C subfamily serine protease